MEITATVTIQYQDESIDVNIFPPRHTHYGKSFYPLSFEEEEHTIERDKHGKWLCKSIGKELCNKIIKELERLKIE
jgi:hypothetical protein